MPREIFSIVNISEAKLSISQSNKFLLKCKFHVSSISAMERKSLSRPSFLEHRLNIVGKDSLRFGRLYILTQNRIMRSQIVIEKDKKNEQDTHLDKCVSLHAFSDLSHISPASFVYLLKEGYRYGTEKATAKFRVLQYHVLLALDNAPQPGPSAFVAQCLYIVPLLGAPYAEGFSHLLISSLARLKKRSPVTDSSDVKHLATQLFLDTLTCSIVHEERILLKLLTVFDIKLNDIGEVLCGSELNGDGLNTTKAYVERYVLAFIESQSYMTAVTLLEHFSIHISRDSFLLEMLQSNQFKAAEKWVTFMGKPMLCFLVQKYLDMKMIKNAYDLIKTHDLHQEFPDAQHLHKEWSLKKLAEKGCWDIAEERTKNDKQLLEYLVYLAMEAGYTEKVDELCERYSLEGFVKSSEDNAVGEGITIKTHYLEIQNFVLDDIVWVDEINGLLSATNYIEERKVIGIDTEWKPNYEKGSNPNKVSIMQVASDSRAYIFDLIKLYQDEPKALDSCFRRIMCSPNILKLGYNLQCDLQQLSHSYGELQCFTYYEMLLDIQKLFKESAGGLSGLCQKILGASLNKTRRNSNWELRPLSSQQIEYAALDAVVLVHIFRLLRDQAYSSGLGEGCKVEWKSKIVSHMGKPRRMRSS